MIESIGTFLLNWLLSWNWWLFGIILFWFFGIGALVGYSAKDDGYSCEWVCGCIFFILLTLILSPLTAIVSILTIIAIVWLIIKLS